MSCAGFVLNEDNERVCECGDEGRLCRDCIEVEIAHWKWLYAAAPLSERDPEAYAEQMRDGARGHLLGDSHD